MLQHTVVFSYQESPKIQTPLQLTFNKRLKGYFVNAWNKYKQKGDNFLLLLNNAAKRETFQIIKQMFMASLLLPITISMLSKKNFSLSQAHFFFNISCSTAKKALI